MAVGAFLKETDYQEIPLPKNSWRKKRTLIAQMKHRIELPKQMPKLPKKNNQLIQQ